jgi:branched-chain amino acid transport system substrate-binding protein
MKKPGMILINNPWGESNEVGFKAALEKRGIAYTSIERIESSDLDVVPQLSRLKEKGTDTLLMVANVAPSAQVVKSLEKMNWDVPVVSHWGPAGGRFGELAGPTADRVHFIQTFVFTDITSGKGSEVFSALQAKYPEIKTTADVTPAVGIANAYDAMHLTALAIEKAGSTKGKDIRDGFYKIDSYEGLIKSFSQPFSKDQHDAIGPNDYVFTQFVGDQISPVK